MAERPRLVPVEELPFHLLRALDNRLRRDGMEAAESIMQALEQHGYRVKRKELAERKDTLDYIFDSYASNFFSPAVFENEPAKYWATEYMLLDLIKTRMTERQEAIRKRLDAIAESYDGPWGWMLGEDTEEDNPDQAGNGE